MNDNKQAAPVNEFAAAVAAIKKQTTELVSAGVSADEAGKIAYEVWRSLRTRGVLANNGWLVSRSVSPFDRFSRSGAKDNSFDAYCREQIGDDMPTGGAKPEPKIDPTELADLYRLLRQFVALD